MASLNGLCTHQQLIDYALAEIRARQNAASALLADAQRGRIDRIAASGVIAEHRDQACSVADTISTALISLGADGDLLQPLHAARYALHRDLSAAVHGVRVGGVEVREVVA